MSDTSVYTLGSDATMTTLSQQDFEKRVCEAVETGSGKVLGQFFSNAYGYDISRAATAGLVTAARVGNVEALNILLHASPMIDGHESFGHPLTAAVEGATSQGGNHNHYECMQRLLQAGADANAHSGLALRKAVEVRDDNSAHMLISHGASLYMKPPDGKSALDLADPEYLQKLFQIHHHAVAMQAPMSMPVVSDGNVGSAGVDLAATLPGQQHQMSASELMPPPGPVNNAPIPASNGTSRSDELTTIYTEIPAHWQEIYRCAHWGTSDWGYGRLEIPKGSNLSFKQAVSDESKYMDVFGEFNPSIKKAINIKVPVEPQPNINGNQIQVMLNNQPSKRRLTGFVKDVRGALFGPLCADGTKAVKSLRFYFIGEPDTVGIGWVAIGKYTPLPQTPSSGQKRTKQAAQRKAKKQATSQVQAAAAQLNGAWPANALPMMSGPMPINMLGTGWTTPSALGLTQFAMHSIPAALTNAIPQLQGAQQLSADEGSPLESSHEIQTENQLPPTADQTAALLAAHSEDTMGVDTDASAQEQQQQALVNLLALSSGNGVDQMVQECVAQLTNILQESPQVAHIFMANILPLLRTIQLVLQFHAQPVAAGSAESEVRNLQTIVATMTVERDQLRRHVEEREKQLSFLQDQLMHSTMKFSDAHVIMPLPLSAEQAQQLQHAQHAVEAAAAQQHVQQAVDHSAAAAAAVAHAQEQHALQVASEAAEHQQHQLAVSQQQQQPLLPHSSQEQHVHALHRPLTLNMQPAT